MKGHADFLGHQGNLLPLVCVRYYYRPSGGARLFDMKVVSSYVFLRTYYVLKKVMEKC